jgi:E3 ubiquitin-protein ligase listerin
VQLLLKLSAKGVFQRHPAHAVLARDFVVAAGRWRLLSGGGGGGEEAEDDDEHKDDGDAEAPLQLFAALLALRADIAGCRRPPPNLRTSLDASWSEALGLALATGAAVAVAGAAGPRAAAPVEGWASRRGRAWRALASALERDDGGADQALPAALEAANARLEAVGVDAVGALLALLRRDGGMAGGAKAGGGGDGGGGGGGDKEDDDRGAAESLRAVAWHALLHPRALARLSYAEAAAAEERQQEEDGERDGGGTAAASASGASAPPPPPPPPLPVVAFDLEFDGDVAAYLTAAGVRPEMAAVIADDGAALAAGGGIGGGASGSSPPGQHQQRRPGSGSRGGGGGGGAAAASSSPFAARAERRLLLHWALLLAHLGELAPASPGHRRLALALRDAGDCVAVLLDLCVAAMRLLQGGGVGVGGGSVGGVASPGTTAAATTSAAAAPGADLGPVLDEAGAGAGLWSLRAALRHRGVPPPPSGSAAAPRAWRVLSACCFRGALAQLPASARLWFGSLRDKALAMAVEAYASRQESPALLAAEFEAVRQANSASYRKGAVGEKFRVRADARLREVSATLDVEDGASLELIVRLPACSPLKPPEVTCSNRVGVPDAKLRRWLLSVSSFLRSQNQGVLEAVSLWRRSLEREFRGVEPCLICYAVLSPGNGQVPKLTCKNCGVVFHGACLYKWFKSSGKSNCVHCQNPWG